MLFSPLQYCHRGWSLVVAICATCFSDQFLHVVFMGFVWFRLFSFNPYTYVNTVIII
jgi:hypothetical protein